MIEEDISKTYDQKPVVVIHSSDQEAFLVQLCKRNKWKYAEGVSQEVLGQIRHWDYGVLIIKASEGRGVDTRFRKDALVLISTEVCSYLELQ
jgi:hypothetical protein